MALASRPLTRPPRQPVEPLGLLKRIQGRVVFIQPDGQEGVYGIQSDEGFIRLLPGGRPPVGDDGTTGYTVGTYLALVRVRAGFVPSCGGGFVPVLEHVRRSQSILCAACFSHA